MHEQQSERWAHARREADRWRESIDAIAGETGRLGLRGRPTVASRLSRLNALHAQAIGLMITFPDELGDQRNGAGALLERIWKRCSELQDMLREEIRGLGADERDGTRPAAEEQMEQGS